MILKRTLCLLPVLLTTLMVASCGPEAKKKRALEGGNKYFEKGQYKQARLMYASAVKTDPRFGEAYYRLALTNLRLGSAAEAVGNLRRAVELQPDNVDAQSQLADLYLSAYSQNPKKYKDLLKDIRELADRISKQAKGSYEDLRLSGYLALSESKTDEALALFQKANQVKPNQVSLETVIARTLLFQKRTDEAIAFLRGMVARDKTIAAPYELLYSIYRSQDNKEAAEKILLDRIAANPKSIIDRLRLATHYLSLNRQDLSEKILAETLTRRSEFPNAYRDIGDYYYRLRQWDRAAATYEEAAKNDPENRRMFEKRLVEVRVSQNRSQEALEMVERILKEDPKDPEAIAMRASLWLYAGKPEQINTAISEMQSVVSKMPDNFVLRYNLGRALMAKGDLDAAKVQFTDAIRYRADYLPARMALAQLYLARKEYGAAQTAANEVLQLDPANQYARLVHSQSMIEQRKFPEAKALLIETLKLNPELRDAKWQLGYILIRENNFKDAEVQFQQLYALKPPDIRGLLGLAEIYTINKQPEKALAILDAEAKKFPKSNVLKMAWADTASRMGKTNEAISVYNQILETSPKSFDVRMRIAEVYRQSNMLPQAIDEWKKAGEINPNNVRPVLLRAMALDSQNRKSEAAPLYEIVLKTEPDNVVALNNYSFYLADQGQDLNLALSYAQKAKAKQPNDPMISDTLGYVYLKKNLPDNAATIFSELAGKHPNVALFQIRLAAVYLQQGQRDKAKRALDEARKLKPTDADKTEIERLNGRLS